LLVNDVIGRVALNLADSVFLNLDRIVDEDIEQPIEPTASGSAESLVDWDTIGRYGKEFIAAGPAQQQISDRYGFMWVSHPEKPWPNERSWPWKNSSARVDLRGHSWW
jgi:uncharacterized membrane protein